MTAKTHFISSNSPSGGTKLIVRSESNSFNRTHWWNWQSSSSTASLVPRSEASSTSLSFKPNLHSGVPDKYARIRIWPSTSALKTVPKSWLDIIRQSTKNMIRPFALIIKLTVSTTSTNASFFLYLTSGRRQLIAPVACVVILDDSSC